jgi:hypothetical protein
MNLLKPRSISGIGAVQFFLALFFVIWLLVFPDTSRNFAWPVQSRLTALFLGASFILRTFLGYRLWRETYWYRLRWIVWGNYVFLGTIFIATFGHMGEMNWKANLLMAHVWVLAYIVEPAILPFAEPRGPDSHAPVPPELAEGPLLPGLKTMLVGLVVVGLTIGGLLFLNPAFLDTRWPWPLDPFDARIMAAWPLGWAAWAGTLYFLRDWAEAKMGVQGLILFLTSHLGVWALTMSQYDPARHNRITFGIMVGVPILLLVYGYWNQERARASRTLKAGTGFLTVEKAGERAE